MQSRSSDTSAGTGKVFCCSPFKECTTLIVIHSGYSGARHKLLLWRHAMLGSPRQNVQTHSARLQFISILPLHQTFHTPFVPASDYECPSISRALAACCCTRRQQAMRWSKVQTRASTNLSKTLTALRWSNSTLSYYEILLAEAAVLVLVLCNGHQRWPQQ